MTEYRSDVAIVMLNHYPVAIARRAIESICRQATSRQWTLYLGFHDRPAAHREAVRRACAGLPVHFVTLERDYVFDARARDVVLQEAIARGHHEFLFFLDDDDEWYPDYVESMAAQHAPFATCAKDVEDEDTGAVAALQDDIDYEGMAFRFVAWGAMRLPFFAKQAADKFVCREFRRRYPSHPHVARPLYRVHRHRNSLTFRKVLGRRGAAEDAIEFVVVSRQTGAGGRVPRDLRAVAEALDAKPRSLADVVEPCHHRPRVLLAPLPLVPGCRERLGALPRRSRDLLVGIANAPIDWIHGRRTDVRRRWLDAIAQADAVLLAEPLWVEAYEAIGAATIPVGMPSGVGHDRIRARAAARTGARVERVFIASGPARQAGGDAVLAHLRDLEVTPSLHRADVCWCRDSGARDWGAAILRAYEAGVPCITSSRSSAARVLVGAGDGLIEDGDPAAIAERIRTMSPCAGRAALTDNLPFFRRCFGAFYWRNSLEAYCRSLMNGGSA